jgi:hypothetical protein
MRYLLIPAILAACGTQDLTSSRVAEPAAAPSRNAVGVEHSVVGSGTQKIAPGFEYAVNISVHSDAKGRVWGESTTRIIDLSAYGYSGSGVLHSEPECLRVIGNTAYVSLIITKTFDTNVAKIGDRSVFWVRDGGAGAPDVSHGGPAAFFDPNHEICSTTPPKLPADPVTSGNFIVR